jgi:predicted regulator of Ras-like GTPase activity (Roadblock/LC7/MglB family)
LRRSAATRRIAAVSTGGQQADGGDVATQDMSWLLDSFADATSGVSHTIAVSADGLLIGASRYMTQEQADQLAAVVAGLIALANGASRCFDAGSIKQTIVEMHRGLLFLVSIGDGSALAALTARGCDVAQVAYELTLLVDRVGNALESAPRPTMTTA